MTIEIWGIIAAAAVVIALIIFIVSRSAKGKPAGELKAPAEPQPTAEEVLPAKEEPAAAEAEPTPAELEPVPPEEPPAAPPKEPVRESLIPGVEVDETAEREAAAKLKEARRDRKLKRLRQGLAPTRGGLIAKIGNLFKEKKELDPAIVEELEETLITADIGAKTTEWLVSMVKAALDKNELQDPQAVWEFLKEEVRRVLSVDDVPLALNSDKPYTIMVVGVNGVGKTTTIGKLATTWADQGKKVVLAAADTFRAAAVNQLEIWGRRANAEVVKSKEGADPSSVVFDAIKKAKESDADIVIADTAGRLHTKTPLMEELKKVKRVMTKAHDAAPHQVLLVLDATTGQNAIQQVAMFKETLDISGLVLTKLDGTAKGGVIIGICHEHKLPIRYIGIGEAKEDLRTFEVDDFIEALFFKESNSEDA